MSDEIVPPTRIITQSDAELMRLERSLHTMKLSSRLEAVRMAQQTLMENAKSRPVGEREVTAEQITEYAQKLLTVVGE